MSNLLFETDFILNQCDEMKKLTGAFSSRDIFFFDYVRVYRNKSRLHLSNHENWVKHFFSHHYDSNTLYFESSTKPHSNTIVYSFTNLWGNFNDAEKVNAISNQFDIGCGITITRFFDEFVENFYLATKKENVKIYEYYLNNTRDLLNVCYFFLDKSKKLIKHAEQNRFPPPKIIYPLSVIESTSQHADTNYGDQFDAKHYRLPNAVITQNEASIINWLARGKTCWEIAKITNVSSRTVETRLNEIKKKLNCVKSTQLIYVAMKLGII